jgi:hypothetical protein
MLAVPHPLISANTSHSDQDFLDEIEYRAVLYFIEQTDPDTGLTRDRAPADGSPSSVPASISASGFALTAWGIAAERGWVSFDTARERVQVTLRFVLDHVEHKNGWLYHFISIEDGRRAWKSEVSTIDTALFLQGAIFAREYFHDAEIKTLVAKLYRRIDWNWALNGGTTLSHGWKPESGFIPYRWEQYAEMLGLYLLGIGAPSRPLPASAWHAWRREPVMNYAGRTFIHCAPLFTHQFSHAWFDFRGRHDDYADYFRNSVDATLAQRQWCADLSSRFPRWSLNLWGLTASDSASGYIAWGGPAEANSKLDGTLVPCAPGGSLPFAPAECLTALRSMRETGGDKVWKRYGFVDSFNPQSDWAASDVIAIDQGITLVMAENLRSGLIWSNFMQATEVQRALRLCGFKDNNTASPLLIATIR